ncbi:MAG: citrate synthase [Candidatus Abyssubacteria bacterium]
MAKRIVKNKSAKRKSAVKRKTCTLEIDEQRIKLPVHEGTDGSKNVDISGLFKNAGIKAFNPGLADVATCRSAISFVDGEKGILLYRGYPIEELAENTTFVETAYLLIKEHLPTLSERTTFSRQLTHLSNIHEDMKHYFEGFPSSADPMAMLSSMIIALSTYHQDDLKKPTEEAFEIASTSLLAKIKTIAAFSYKKKRGEPYEYPQDDLSYCANLLYMLFDRPNKRYEINDRLVRVLNKILILHADHEQNCSTTTVRTVGSSGANIFVSISAGVNALSGPRHGGANQDVLRLLQRIHADGDDVQKYVRMAKDSKNKFMLPGFGHRVYRNYDPRARICKDACDVVLDILGIHDPLLEIAKKLEEAALKDDYFIERRLYPNVDFYSCIIFSALGLPAEMFPVMFAIGRLPGWIAHWKEAFDDPENRIIRPGQIYTGMQKRAFIPIEKRK